MVAWLIIIVAVSAFQVISVSYSFPPNYVYLSTIVMFLSAIGLLYRVYAMRRRIKTGKKDHKLLGQILRQAGLCSAEKILEALNAQSAGDKRRLGELLIDMGAITSEQLENALKIQTGKDL